MKPKGNSQSGKSHLRTVDAVRRCDFLAEGSPDERQSPCSAVYHHVDYWTGSTTWAHATQRTVVRGFVPRGVNHECHQLHAEPPVSTIFIGGSRHVSHLSEGAKERINNVMDKNHDIVVGDANGADKAVQKFLHEAGYRKVTVYCSGDRPRNNLGQWSLHSVTPPKAAKGFQFYAAKDCEMAVAADFGLMIWDGKSPGTVLNVLRLLRAGKAVVLIHGSATPTTLKSAHDWEAFLDGCSDELRTALHDRATPEEWQPGSPHLQPGLFSATPTASRVAEQAAEHLVDDLKTSSPAAPGQPKQPCDN
jgi:adenine-specific DNA-methyltransferase